MIGIVLAALGSVFAEAADIVGRTEAKKKHETVFSMGFLQTFWATIFFVVWSLVSAGSFRFDYDSLPTFILKMVLEVIQVYATISAVITADRSSFGFIRVLTIPLLLIVDIFLGYQLAPMQSVGVSLIVIAMLILFTDHNFSKKGAGLVLFGAVNSVATISLYKYNITHYNSVVAEQTLTLLIILAFLTVGAVFITKEHPLRMLGQKKFFLQSFSDGLAVMAGSFAFLYAPASIISAVRRSTAVLMATISGNLYFQERHIAIKLGMFALLTVGIILIVV
jgi:hypothetical protein